MGIIHTLPLHEAQKIAAGEVVERPCNIVKELVENALDAQATEITLYIENGGKDLIRCIDNGTGMSAEDAHKALEHHATSKISKIEDLETLATFGFRGEALSSIASISNITLITRLHADNQATKLIVQGGMLKEDTIIAHAPGTDITIKDIFFNVPVRKKFLKTRETEWRALYTLIQALALAHHTVSFKVYHDEANVLTTHATKSLEERISQIFDRSFSQHFIECDTQKRDAITISGGITHYQYQRYDRNQQFFFVNNRWIKNYKLGQAFMKGFQGVMPPGKYPAGVIFIDLPQPEVDINVHPRKEEVVFLHPRLIEIILEDMIRKRLEKETAHRIISPQASVEYSAPKTDYSLFSTEAHNRNPLFLPKEIIEHQGQQTYMPTGESLTKPYSAVTELPVTVDTTQQPEIIPYRIIGQLHKTYILIENDQDLVIIDQHAAHECVLYEQFSSKSNEVIRVQLLFPEVIHLEAEQQKTLLKLTNELHGIGITLESMGETTIAVTETPLYVKNYPLKDLIYDILGWVAENGTSDADGWNNKICKKMYAMMACKAAVKAGDELNYSEMEKLLTSLYATHHRLTCPHGRPTTWAISPYDLEKIFKRTR